MQLRSHYGDMQPEVGCDEAGRGCLAGPVCAAAVVLPEKVPLGLAAVLDDSKKLSAHTRKMVREEILACALSFGVSFVEPEIIDEINILNASILAMHQALDSLKVKPAMILVDGNRFKPYDDIPHVCIVRGDGLYLSIAAASVLAKTFRDDAMETLHNQFPLYGWRNNKGYPTAEHRMALLKYGKSPQHRQSFRLFPPLTLDV